MSRSPSNELLDQLALDWANGKISLNEALRIAFVKGYDTGWRNQQFFEDGKTG